MGVPLSNSVENMVSGHVDWLVEHSFQQLKGINIEYAPVTKQTDNVFFETYIKITSLFRRRRRRTYQILANESLSNDNPGDLAIRSILAHELSHLLDYIDLSLWGLAKLKIMLRKETFQRDYERQTDVQALERGYGEGLIEYRNWLYGKIVDPDQLARKKYIYMTPDEIRAWLS